MVRPARDPRTLFYQIGGSLGRNRLVSNNPNKSIYISGVNKNEKSYLLTIIDTLDLKAELVPLSASERDATRDANDYLAKLRRDEESKWAHRAKVRHTKHFYLIANGNY